MVVGIKDAAKLTGLLIISGCAVFVCTLFLNFRLDLISIKEGISSEQEFIFYEAQVSTIKVVCWVSGGCLLLTSLIMLLFYIKHYIDRHKKELGILKALGYSHAKIAMNFWVFGISILLGTAAGFGGAFLLMKDFYEKQNEAKVLPEILVHFHPILFWELVIIPAAAFSLLAIAYAGCKLRKPVLTLLKEQELSGSFSLKRKRRQKQKNKNNSFVDELKTNNIREKKILVFFVIFASFCFSGMTQMAASMQDLASAMMGVMILVIGIILAYTTFFLAMTAVINGNKKTLAMMRVFGYSDKDCRKGLLDGYRPMAYIGFFLGTIYQYVLLRMMVDLVFKEVEGVPVYSFDFPVMVLSLISFIILYEGILHWYSQKIKKISIKEIMLE